jgi:hypothetical protein
VIDWWAQHSPAIRATMHKRLEQIKDPTQKSHIAKSFAKRADYLDSLAANGFKPGWEEFTVDE